MGIANVLSLLSGIALFLFGMSLMGDGLKKVAGSSLELILYRLSSTPLKGVLLGTGVTAVIQSSSATSVMVVGFVNSNMLKLEQAVGIVLGSCLGTSITGWVLCLSNVSGSGWVSLISTTTLTSVVAVVGILLRMFTKKQQNHHIGDIMLGFAVLMFGMTTMSGAVSPLRESEAFCSIVTTFSNPFLGILVGFVFAAILQSASAAVGILQALSMTGAIDFSVALPLILGISVGAAVPVLLSALGANTNGKRTAWGYLIINAVGVILWGIIFYAVEAAVEFPFMGRVMTPVSVALVNSVYRFLTVVLLTPFIGQLSKLLTVLTKDKPEDRELSADMERLEERFLVHPALAVEQSRMTINAMAEKAQRNLETAFGLLGFYSAANYEKVQSLESMVDRYEDKLGTYLVKLTGHELDTRQNKEVSKFLHTIGDFERLSDHAVNIAEAAKEISEKNIALSDGAVAELEVLTGAVVEVVDLAIRSFVYNDIGMAQRVEPLEEVIDDLCDAMKLHHVDRLQAGSCTLSQGFVFNDLLTNYERVADHCSNVAVAIIELESQSFETHEYLQELKDMRTETFRQYQREYEGKYHI